MKKTMIILIILMGMFTFSFSAEKRVEKQTKVEKVQKVKKKINYKSEYERLMKQDKEHKQKMAALREQNGELQKAKKVIKIEYDKKLAALKKCNINAKKLKDENDELRIELKELKAKLKPVQKKKAKKLKKIDS